MTTEVLRPNILENLVKALEAMFFSRAQPRFQGNRKYYLLPVTRKVHGSSPDVSRNMAGGKFRFAIDRGGTFTDVYSECPNGEVKVMKLLSVDPAYPDAPREGIRRILQEVIN